MAFNPFHKFRKHQKVIFAFITIFCMLSFVACSGLQGGGDMMHWMQGLFMGRSTAQDIGSVDGKGVNQLELVEMAQRREIANIFMASATEAALQAKMQKLRPPGDTRMTPESFQRIFRDPDVVYLQQRLNNQPYFGGSLKTEGLMEFKMWLNQADQLGIHMTPANVKAMVAHLTLGKEHFNDRDSGAIERGLKQRYRNFSPELLIAALGDEFRVQFAQAALLGLEPSTNARMPIPATPQEFWEFYKENQTRVDLRLVGVRVEDYLSQVKDTPREAELLELYKKFKDKEYSPDSKDPGFKTPRRIQVQWVAGTSSADHFKKLAANFRIKEQAARKVAAAAGAALNGLLAVNDIAIAAALDPRLIKEYDDTKWRNFQAASYAHNWRWAPYPMHDASYDQPSAVAAAVGMGAADVPAMGIVGAYLGTAVAKEIDARVQRGLTWTLTAAQPTPQLMAAAMAAEMLPRSEYIPLADVKDKVNERIDLFLAQDLFAGAMKAIQKEVEAMAKADDKGRAEANERIAKLVAEAGFQTGKTGGPRGLTRSMMTDDSNIARDPGLAALKAAYLKPPSLDAEGKRFGNLFFTDKAAFVVERFPQSQFRAADDETEWKAAPESFLFWKTEDKPARTLEFDNPEVRKEVEYAWRFNKARELARKDAEALAAKLKEDKGDPRRLRDTAEKLKKELIELNGLAKRNQEPSFRPEVAFMWNPPRIPEDKVPNAGMDFGTKLLALQDKDKGDTLVVPNLPEAVYYVGVLVDKKEPNLADFLTTYQNASPTAVRRDPLLMMFEQEKLVNYFQDALKLLKQESKLTIDKDKLKDTDFGAGEEN